MTGFRFWIYKSKIYSDSPIVNDLSKIYCLCHSCIKNGYTVEIYDIMN